jgi:hypothetical protein
LLDNLNQLQKRLLNIGDKYEEIYTTRKDVVKERRLY